MRLEQLQFVNNRKHTLHQVRQHVLLTLQVQVQSVQVTQHVDQKSQIHNPLEVRELGIVLVLLFHEQIHGIQKLKAAREYLAF